MSRVHEALSRAAGAPAKIAESADQPFVSAWAEERAEPPERPAAAPGDSFAPAPTPAVAAETAAPLAALAVPALDRFKSGWRERLTIWPQADPLLVEQFRRLAATLVQRQRTDGLKRIMVASASPNDGKTLTAVNLALSLSESYRHRVLLVDGDLRRPSIGDLLSLPPAGGLSAAVKEEGDRTVPVTQVTERLSLLPAGRPDADPVSALTSPRLERLFRDAAESFDWVVIDSPPVGATADAGLLCALADTALLVVRAGETPHDAVQQAIDTFGAERIHGVVLNGVEQSVVRSYGTAEYLSQAAP